MLSLVGTTVYDLLHCSLLLEVLVKGSVFLKTNPGPQCLLLVWLAKRLTLLSGCVCAVCVSVGCYACVFPCVHVCLCMLVCVSVCVHVCVSLCVSVHSKSTEVAAWAKRPQIGRAHV